MSRVQEELIKKINSDPVLWAKSHIITYDNAAKKYVPWTARWYQAEMLRDNSRKKVYRCGRRTGKGDYLPFGRELREVFSSREKEETIIRGQDLFLLDKDKVQRLL